MLMSPLTTSINDAAKALSLGRSSIYALINDGRLETIKIGRRRLIKIESIRQLLSGRK
jgi:excisionase family DNA binding protein